MEKVPQLEDPTQKKGTKEAVQLLASPGYATSSTKKKEQKKAVIGTLPLVFGTKRATSPQDPPYTQN